MISLSCQPKLARSTTLAQPVFQGKDTLKTLTGDNNISNAEKPGTLKEDSPIITGAERIQEYLPWLEGKKVALVVNQTSIVGQQHLVDVLLEKGVDIKKIFAPEHGFRDMADAGEKINNGIDSLTGLTCISLYGSRKEPSKEDLEDIDLVIFDIQDVGVRFYTYISTLHYVMKACATYHKMLIVLDRPNPNGHYTDGPVRQPGFESFVGLDPIPVVHGLTMAELAKMINGEGWLGEGLNCPLLYVPCENYQHDKVYHLPVKPSPNMVDMRSVYLYPSLCFFEGTVASVGRGTDKPFQMYGHPDFIGGNTEFTPKPVPGAKKPLLEGKLCKGFDLSAMPFDSLFGKKYLDLDYLINFYQLFENKQDFFLENHFIDKLAGTDQLRLQIMAGESAETIRASWQPALETYNLMRKKYLIYQ